MSGRIDGGMEGWMDGGIDKGGAKVSMIVARAGNGEV